jgi:short-subunit dehydrogenase
MTSQTKRYALITGASSGIGKSTAIAFAQQGIYPVLVSRNQAKLAEVAQQISEFGVEAKVCPVDLADVQTVKAAITAIANDVGAIDILVNNAGMAYTGNLAEMPLADWQQVMNLNLTSVLQCVQAVLPKMRQQQRGTIINVVSIAGHQAFPDWGAYCASKFGLMALTKTLAAEERANGIRVIAVSPGSVNTPIWDTKTVSADFDRSRMLTPEIVAQTIVYAAMLPEQAVIEDLTLMPSAGTF